MFRDEGPSPHLSVTLCLSKALVINSPCVQTHMSPQNDSSRALGLGDRVRNERIHNGSPSPLTTKAIIMLDSLEIIIQNNNKNNNSQH